MRNTAKKMTKLAFFVWFNGTLKGLVNSFGKTYPIRSWQKKNRYTKQITPVISLGIIRGR